MHSIPSLLAGALLLCAVATGPAFGDVFVETDGLLIIEAESSPAAGDWVLERSIGGYSGSGYLRWNGPDFFAVSQAGAGTITYRFRIQRAGNYELLWRSRITRGDNRTEHNDSWVRFPTGNNINNEHGLNGWTKVFMSTLDRWTWQSATVDGVGRRVRQYFSAGEHTVQISGRSNGHAIDRIALFDYSDPSIATTRFDSIATSTTLSGETPDLPAPAPTPISPPDTPDPAVHVTAPVVAVSGAVLSWPAVDARAFNVHHGNGDWIESLPGTATRWQAPLPGDYYLVATGDGGWETWGRSATVQVTSTPDSQGAGESLSITTSVYSASALELFWSPADPRIASVEVRRDDRLLTVTDGRSHFDDGLAPGTRYRYTLTALDTTGNVLVVDSVDVTTQQSMTPGDGAAGGLALYAEVYSPSAVELFWSLDTATMGPDTRFAIYRDGELMTTRDGRSLFIDALQASTTYEFDVIASDSAGNVLSSESVRVTTISPDSP